MLSEMAADVSDGSLVDTTPVEESNEVYITKLALSVGRSKHFAYVGLA